MLIFLIFVVLCTRFMRRPEQCLSNKNHPNFWSFAIFPEQIPHYQSMLYRKRWYEVNFLLWGYEDCFLIEFTDYFVVLCNIFTINGYEIFVYIIYPPYILFAVTWLSIRCIGMQKISSLDCWIKSYSNLSGIYERETCLDPYDIPHLNFCNSSPYCTKHPWLFYCS